MPISVKLEIIKKKENGASNAKIAREYALIESTVRGIIKMKDTILSQAKVMTESGVELSIPCRNIPTRTMIKLERLVCIWLQDLETRNFPVGLSQIQSKAKILFDSIKENLVNPTDEEIKQTFKASPGWFSNFQHRRGFKSINLTGEAASADHAAAKEYPETFQKIVSDGNYLDKQIFNVDESGFNWKRPPCRSYIQTINKTKSAGTKLLEDRCTVLFGGNAAGHKLKPYLLYKFKNPRCFKGVSKNTLPVNFRSNRKAWMTSSSFRDWYVNFFLPDGKKYCDDENIAFKLLLIVDNAPSHPDLSDICENVKIIYLPANTTSLLQPMDMGIISIVKTNFKHLLLDTAIKAANSNKETFLEFLKQFTIKNAIDLLGIAWSNVPTSAMIGVWKQLRSNEVDSESKGLANEKIKEIIELGKNFGFNDMDVDNVELEINHQEDDLSIEDLFEMYETEKISEKSTNIQNQNEIEILEPPRILKADVVKKALQSISDACDLLAEADPDIERFIKFQQAMTVGSSLYKNWLKETQDRREKQKVMSDFFLQPNE